jgi:hypothetical protein
MDELIKTIKLNCHISDASYWGNFSICGLLMRLRDLYRTEKGLKPWHSIPKEDISLWISERESLWKGLEGKRFIPLPVKDEMYDPFDVDGVNEKINSSGYVYGAGYGLYMKPTFFIAEIGSKKEISDYRIYISKRELARDLFSSSAMLQGRCIFIRLDPLKSLLWEKFISLKSKKKTHIESAFLKFGLTPSIVPDKDEKIFENLFEEMALKYSDMHLYHEIAEAIEDIPEWKEIIIATKDKKLELILRALKDLIADTSDYGPIKWSLEKNELDSLRLYIDFIEGYRAILYPSILEISKIEDLSRIEDIRIEAYKTLNNYRKKIIDLSKEKPEMIKEFLKAEMGIS